MENTQQEQGEVGQPVCSPVSKAKGFQKHGVPTKSAASLRGALTKSAAVCLSRGVAHHRPRTSQSPSLPVSLILFRFIPAFYGTFWDTKSSGSRDPGRNPTLFRLFAHILFRYSSPSRVYTVWGREERGEP